MVLVVEDDPDIRILERMVLEGSGYNVNTATNGREALQRLATEDPPCVIVLDLMMPVMDGLAFLAQRREDPALQDIPVICVSAGGPELMAQARRLGAAACVAKTTDFDELCGLVGQYCFTQP